MYTRKLIYCLIIFLMTAIGGTATVSAAKKVIPQDRDKDGIVDTKDRYPLDHDNDGIKDAKDMDDDNDGIPDKRDKYPYDFDNDKIRDDKDTDDDNDGIPDKKDPQPFKRAVKKSASVKQPETSSQTTYSQKTTTTIVIPPSNNTSNPATPVPQPESPQQPTNIPPQPTSPVVVPEQPQSNSQPTQGTMFTDAQILEKINAHKSFFNQRKSMKVPDGEKQYGFVDGKGKVLISAPHSAEQIREGAEKAVDYCTGPIARALAEMGGAPVYYLQYQSRDPNYYDDTEYKSALAEYLALHPGIGYVFDIHGASTDRAWAVDLGDMNGASLVSDDGLSNELQTIFTQRGITPVSRNYFSASVNQTVTKFASARGKNAVQIEIQASYRCETNDKTIALMRALYDIVKKYQ